MRVFIVEDDPIIVEGLKIALAQENFEVDSFGTMTDAINAVNGEAHYDVCLLDVNLPDGDGARLPGPEPATTRSIRCWLWSRAPMIT